MPHMGVSTILSCTSSERNHPVIDFSRCGPMGRVPVSHAYLCILGSNKCHLILYHISSPPNTLESPVSLSKKIISSLCNHLF